MRTFIVTVQFPQEDRDPVFPSTYGVYANTEEEAMRIALTEAVDADFKPEMTKVDEGSWYANEDGTAVTVLTWDQLRWLNEQ
jgi:hypothetical protein